MDMERLSYGCSNQMPRNNHRGTRAYQVEAEEEVDYPNFYEPVEYPPKRCKGNYFFLTLFPLSAGASYQNITIYFKLDTEL